MAAEASDMNNALALQAWQTLRSHGLSLTVLFVVLKGLYNYYASPLRKYPGPFLASCTRLWQAYVAWSGNAEEYYMNAHRKYGPIVRLGPNEVSFSSPLAAMELFKTGKGFHKTDFYTVFLPDGRKDIFTEIRESYHAVKKRFAVPAYSLAAVQKHGNDIESVMRNFLTKMDGVARAEPGTSCDLGSWLHYLAFDTLGQFAFAKPIGFLDAGNDMGGAITAISRSTYESGVIGQLPFVEQLTRSNPLKKFIPFVPKNNSAVFFHIVANAMKQYEDPESIAKGPNSLLRSLLESHHRNSERFTMDDVLSITMGAVAAGSDSTASTMQSFVWHVLSNPQIHQRLVDELLASELSEIVQFKEAQSLRYFQACFKEAMRLQPAVGFNITRKVPPGGAEINGTWLPGGTQVAVNAWVMHREEIFGSYPDSFKPERWLDISEDQVKAMERCMFQFGGGSHICIGRHLALYQMNKVLPQIFRRYDMQLVSPAKLPHVTGFFYIQTGLNVYLKLHESVLASEPIDRDTSHEAT